LEYVDAYSGGAKMEATLLEVCPFGSVVNIDGAKMALSWDRLVLAELVED
jgi:hypothetical protein